MDILHSQRNSEIILDRENAPLSNSGGGLREGNEIYCKAMEDGFIPNSSYIFRKCWCFIQELQKIGQGFLL